MNLKFSRVYNQVNQRNNLFPVFLKLEELDTLLVGGGNVGLEKLSALLKSSPEARVKVVSKKFHNDILPLAEKHPNVVLIERGFRTKDLQYKDLIILATDDAALHKKIRELARQKRILVNVADTPALCDFYLGSVVTKGNVKVGISTNGRSPTMAKRMREFFEEAIPDNVNDLLDNMNNIRDKIKGDFQRKVEALNEITASWLKK